MGKTKSLLQNITIIEDLFSTLGYKACVFQVLNFIILNVFFNAITLCWGSPKIDFISRGTGFPLIILSISSFYLKQLFCDIFQWMLRYSVCAYTYDSNICLVCWLVFLKCYELKVQLRIEIFTNKIKLNDGNIVHSDKFFSCPKKSKCGSKIQRVQKVPYLPLNFLLNIKTSFGISLHRV